MQFLKIFYDKTFLKFIIVGVINTIVGAGVMFALYNIFHFSYWVSSIMNYVTGSIVSFFLNKYFTFKSSSFSFNKYCCMFVYCLLACKTICCVFIKWIFSQCAGKYSHVYRYGNIYRFKLFITEVYCI